KKRSDEDRGRDMEGTVTDYPDTLLFIDGAWRPATGGRTIAVLNPVTARPIGTVARAERADLDEALAAAERGFAVWSATSAYERARTMRRAADILRERAEAIARLETLTGADIVDW